MARRLGWNRDAATRQEMIAENRSCKTGCGNSFSSILEALSCPCTFLATFFCWFSVRTSGSRYLI